MTEIEEKINDVFKMDGETPPDGAPKQNSQRKAGSVFKKPKGRAVRRKKVRLSFSDESDEEESVREENVEKSDKTPVRKRGRTPAKRTARKVASDSDSD